MTERQEVKPAKWNLTPGGALSLDTLEAPSGPSSSTSAASPTRSLSRPSSAAPALASSSSSSAAQPAAPPSTSTSCTKKASQPAPDPAPTWNADAPIKLKQLAKPSQWAESQVFLQFLQKADLSLPEKIRDFLALSAGESIPGIKQMTPPSSLSHYGDIDDLPFLSSEPNADKLRNTLPVTSPLDNITDAAISSQYKEILNGLLRYLALVNGTPHTAALRNGFMQLMTLDKICPTILGNITSLMAPLGVDLFRFILSLAAGCRPSITTVDKVRYIALQAGNRVQKALYGIHTKLVAQLVLSADSLAVGLKLWDPRKWSVAGGPAVRDLHADAANPKGKGKAKAAEAVAASSDGREE
ncbi:hypothetical protein JCM8097_007186 [Rhodosporidiobolus ruineniae]